MMYCLKATSTVLSIIDFDINCVKISYPLKKKTIKKHNFKVVTLWDVLFIVLNQLFYVEVFKKSCCFL